MNEAFDSLERLRAKGWRIAIHNDYNLDGIAHTFYLFTNSNLTVKGEGTSDAIALAQAEAEINRLERYCGAESYAANRNVKLALALEKAVQQLRESNGVIKVLCHDKSGAQVSICNEVLDRNTAAMQCDHEQILREHDAAVVRQAADKLETIYQTIFSTDATINDRALIELRKMADDIENQVQV